MTSPADPIGRAFLQREPLPFEDGFFAVFGPLAVVLLHVAIEEVCGHAGPRDTHRIYRTGQIVIAECRSIVRFLAGPNERKV
jgi:hypothetical protein